MLATSSIAPVNRSQPAEPFAPGNAGGGISNGLVISNGVSNMFGVLISNRLLVPLISIIISVSLPLVETT
jgi:hypothetical protein